MSNLLELKQQQIRSLFQFVKEVSTIVDEKQYEIPCKDSFKLIISLSSQFPNEAPVLTVSPPDLRHPFIDNSYIVHEALTDWNGQSNLGQLVQGLQTEFSKRPPVRKTKNGGDSTESYNYHRPPPPIPPTRETQSAIADNDIVTKTSPSEMEDLLTNEAAFEKFFLSLDRVRYLTSLRTELINGNETIAAKNLDQEEKLSQLREKTKELDEEYRSLKKIYEQKEQEQDMAFSRFSSSTVLTRFKASVNESDELSESVAQSFLDGGLDHDSFVKQFREIRKVYHLRASKLERAQDGKLFPA